MKARLALAVVLMLGPLPAMAQMPPDPAQALVADWQAAATGLGHVGDRIGALIQAYRAQAATLAAERQYWADYVKGLAPPAAEAQ